MRWFNVESMWQNANALSKSHRQTRHRAFGWAINMPFQSSLWAKRTWKKLLCPQSFLAHWKAKLQAPQNPWKHDKVDANKLGQRTDFPGPIIAENLLRKSWLRPAEKWLSWHNYVITRPGCHKCLNVHPSDQSLRRYSLALIRSHVSLPPNNTLTPRQLEDHHVRAQTGMLCFYQEHTSIIKTLEQNCYFTNHHFKTGVGSQGKSSQITANCLPAGDGAHHR